MPVLTVLPRIKERYWWNKLLTTFPVEILVHEADPVEAADLVLWRSVEGPYGFVSFGYGSCSQCDELEACSTYAEVAKVRKEMWERVHWEDNACNMFSWMYARDWKLQWYGHVPHAGKFITRSAEILSPLVETEYHYAR